MTSLTFVFIYTAYIRLLQNVSVGRHEHYRDSVDFPVNSWHQFGSVFISGVRAVLHLVQSDAQFSWRNICSHSSIILDRSPFWNGKVKPSMSLTWTLISQSRHTWPHSQVLEQLRSLQLIVFTCMCSKTTQIITITVCCTSNTSVLLNNQNVFSLTDLKDL